MSEQTSFDPAALSLEGLLAAQEQITAAIRRSLESAGQPEPEPEIPGVVRVAMHRYKARITRVAPRRYKKTYAKEFDRCMLGISLGSPNMQGAKFESCIKWISEKYDHCALVLGDSLYRYTLQVVGGRPAATSRDEALTFGRDFMAEYGPVIDKYREHCIFEWVPLSEVERQPGFEGYHGKFQELYGSHEGFHRLVDDFAEYYLGRVLARGDDTAGEEPEAERERLRGFARGYLLEESALFTLLCERGWRVMIYPGSIRSFEEIAEGRVPEVPEPLQRIIFASLAYDKGGLYFAAGADTFKSVDGDEPDRAPGYEVLADLAEEGWHRLLKYTLRREYRAGDILVRRADTERNLYFLTGGSFEILKGDWKGGKMQRVATLGSGAVFGEQSFVDGRPRSATVAAAQDSEVMILPRKRFTRMLKRDPDIASALLLDISRVMSLRLRGEIK